MVENLVLVRHSTPLVDLRIPPNEWALSEEGISAAKALALFLQIDIDFGGSIWSSTETKAHKTASQIGSMLGLLMSSDARFCEVGRPIVGDPDSYRVIATDYLRGKPADGWEPHQQATSRFRQAVDELMARHDGSSLLIVAHGLVISLFLESIGAVDSRTRHPVEVTSFWSDLTMPDAWRLDLKRNWLDRIGYTWDGSPIATDPPHGAAVLVFRRLSSGLEFLLLHRAGAPDLADWAWTSPAGARLPEEDITACAIRELMEETGLQLSPQLSTTGTDNWPQFFVEVEPDVAIQLSDEHDRWEWVEASEACERCLPIVVSDALRRAFVHLSSDS